MTADAQTDKRGTCLLSFDVEEHFQIEAARGHVPRASWEGLESRVERNIDRLLENLHETGAKATFFTLGWIARRHRAMVGRIAVAGHEVACHGELHDRLHAMCPMTLREDLRESCGILEEITGSAVRGYRAPTFSLTRQTAWAVDVLAEHGIEYDSSVQPIRHPQYGERKAPRGCYRLMGPGGGEVAEIPPLTWQTGPMRWPVAGGGYFRLLPLAMMRRGIEQMNRCGEPAMLYFHPWEFDPDQPRMPLSRAARWRTYVGMDRTRSRLLRLLETYRCLAVRDWIAGHRPSDWPRYSLPHVPCHLKRSA